MSSAGKLDLDPTAYRDGPDKVAHHEMKRVSIFQQRTSILGRMVDFMKRSRDLKCFWSYKVQVITVVDGGSGAHACSIICTGHLPLPTRYAQ